VGSQGRGIGPTGGWYSGRIPRQCRCLPWAGENEGRKMKSQQPDALHSTEPATVRGKLWLWGHDPRAHNDPLGLPQPSGITPPQTAFYLGVPNLIMVRYLGRPALPFDRFALPFRALKRVVWSVVGASGQTDERERAHVLDLAAHHPNITGVMLDDFFSSDPS